MKKRGDKHVKSVVKAFTWRAIASITTFILVWIFTGELTLAIGVGVLEVSLKLLFYYLHERFWNYVKWWTHP